MGLTIPVMSLYISTVKISPPPPSLKFLVQPDGITKNTCKTILKPDWAAQSFAELTLLLKVKHYEQARSITSGR